MPSRAIPRKREAAGQPKQQIVGKETAASLPLSTLRILRVSETEDALILKGDVPHSEPVEMTLHGVNHSYFQGKDRTLRIKTPSSTTTILKPSGGSFSDVFDVERSKIDHQNGVLTIVVPKRIFTYDNLPAEGYPETDGGQYILLDDESNMFSPFQSGTKPIIKFPTLPVRPRDIELPEPENHGRQMVRDDNIVIRKDGTLIKGGIPYRPLSQAAPDAQTHRRTLLTWIKNKTKFQGQPLQSYYFAPLDTYFISEESIKRVANRFIKWPSQEPAGPVTIGETEDRSGFVGMSDAARIAGVSKRTMWLWASHEKAPREKPLDVIKCIPSDYFYIREKDVHDLRKLIPRAGLQRGRRPLTGAQP